MYYFLILFNLKLSIISSLSSRDIYLSLSISLSCLFVTVSDLFCCEYCETFVILLPIKSRAVSTVFWYSIIIILY